MRWLVTKTIETRTQIWNGCGWTDPTSLTRRTYTQDEAEEIARRMRADHLNALAVPEKSPRLKRGHH